MSGSIAWFLALLPLIAVQGLDDPTHLPQSVFLQCGAMALALAHLRANGDGDHDGIAHLKVPFAAVFAWATLSAARAVSVFAAQQVLLQWAAAAMLCWVVRGTVKSVADSRRLLRALFAASVAVSAIGLVQQLTGWDGVPQALPPAGTLGNKNVAANFVAAALPIGAVWFVNAATPLCFLLATGAGAALAYVFHTACRAAWLALSIEALVALWVLVAMWDRRPRLSLGKWSAMASGFGAFVLLASLPPAGGGPEAVTADRLLAASVRPVMRFIRGEAISAERSGAARSGEARADRSVSIRLGVWRNSIEMIREAPVAGVGLGNFEVHYPRFARAAAADGVHVDERVESAHNDYLQLVAELGLAGAALLLWLAVACLRVFRELARSATGEDRATRLACALGLTALLVEAAVTPTLSHPVALAQAATLLGIGMAPMQPLLPRRRATERHGWLPKGADGAVLLGGGATVVALVLWGCVQATADRHVYAMGSAEARQDWRGVVREGLLARDWNPYRKRPRFPTASALLRLGRPAEAAVLLEELVETDPYSANALGNLGIAYAASRNPAAAANCFERALTLRPEDTYARSRLVALRMEANR